MPLPIVRALRQRGARRSLIVLACVVASMLGSYGVTRAFAGNAKTVHPYPASWGGRKEAATNRVTNPLVSGKYLVAYVLVSSECGWCADPQTKDAVRVLRDSLQRAYKTKYAKVSVVGVSIDPEVEAGIKYLAEMDRS